MFNYKCVGKLIKVNTRIDFLLKDIFKLNTPINVLNLHSIIQTKNLLQINCIIYVIVRNNCACAY